MYGYYFFILFLCFCIAPGCALQKSPSNDQLVAEAQAFMEGYAQDLRTRDGTAVAARYNRSGHYMLGAGHKLFISYDSLRVEYEERWQGPDSFEWQDLSYEPISSNAIMVLGKFIWGNDNFEEPGLFSYSGLLVRQDGELRIRVEDYSSDPMSMKEFICESDSTAG
ncbi:hypothetical protein [Rhodohalobacter sp.]|uniref:hypothetical protein n=1 Tax=Rhodohalobacter sp. TaxID=1974210 RepID=UPI002ACDB995|nr:hypothetical protein [Rhodohalobacter sp.]MDZ7757158.1 hypothetical protein [Rhodohalobacter sp.]